MLHINRLHPSGSKTAEIALPVGDNDVKRYMGWDGGEHGFEETRSCLPRSSN